MGPVSLDSATLAGPVISIPDTGIYLLRLVFGEWNALIFIVSVNSNGITVYRPSEIRFLF
jgi:hypothetical protein